MLCFDSMYAAQVVQQSWQAKSHLEVVRFAGELHGQCDLHAKVLWHWSEVTREIWEMRLLTPWPRLELGGSVMCGKAANCVIWKPWFASLRGTCCFGSWLKSLFSTLLKLSLRSQSFCGLWFVSVSIFLSSWYAVSVSASPWNVVYYVLWVTATKFLFVSLESMYLPVGELFFVVFFVPARVLARLSCSLRRLWGLFGL